jgi:hypothetical protein
LENETGLKSSTFDASRSRFAMLIALSPRRSHQDIQVAAGSSGDKPSEHQKSRENNLSPRYLLDSLLLNLKLYAAISNGCAYAAPSTPTNQFIHRLRLACQTMHRTPNLAPAQRHRRTRLTHLGRHLSGVMQGD